MIQRLSTALTVMLLVACGGQSKNQNVQPPKEIGASFKVEPNSKVSGNLAVDKYLIGLKRDALEKEFLLRSQFITQTVAPSFQGMRSRIVAFREHGDELLMLEATQGHLVDNQTPASLLLAKFKIVKEVDGVLYFDLNQGFASLYTAGDWFGSDDGANYSEESLFQSMPLNMSYIEDAVFDSRNQLVVTQVGQLLVPSGDAVRRRTGTNMPLKNKIYLTTYQPTANFQKYATKGDFTQFGYFEVQPMMEKSGYPEVYASKWDSAQPIEYAISANTPADFKEAVREGILYWNKAFGREVMKVVDAPAGVYAPDSNLNIVQWVNWDWAGAAYADAQMDPRTGQILNSQIFMSSVFAISGKARARNLIRRLATVDTAGGVKLNLKGFKPSSLCNRTHDEHFASTLGHLVADPKINDSDILRAAQDYVREVVAHEVGHTLGLRHNFAGNTYGNVHPMDRQSVETDYFLNRHVDPNLHTTSSVMEYQDFTDAFVTGHQITHLSTAMKYDEMAIRHLYEGATYSLKETPLFCTDSMRDKAADCMVWDSGPSTVEALLMQSQDAINLLPEKLMQAFVNGKSPDPNMPQVPVERVVLNAEAMAQRIVDARMKLLNLLEKDSRLLVSERSFEAIDPSGSDEVSAAKMDLVKKDIDRLGGLKKVLAMLDENRKVAMLGTIDLMINSGNYDKGLDDNDVPYQFSSTELSVIRERSKKTIARVFELIPKLEIEALGEWDEELAKHSLSEEYADVLKERVDEWLFATTGQTLKGKATPKEGAEMDVTVPVFKYSYETRSAVARLLNREGTPVLDWGYEQKEAVKTQFKKIMTDGFGEKFDEVKMEGMSRELVRWYLENSGIQSDLDKEKSPEPKKTPEKNKSKKS